VVAIERIAENGIQVRNVKGTAGFVNWDTLRDEHSTRIRLTYGDVISIDAIQSATSTEHLNVLPGGSAEVESFKNYVAQSRARETTWLVVSDGAERRAILDRRAQGNVDPITKDDVWGNIARNLSRQLEELATDLLAHAHAFYTGTVRSLATAFQPKQQREAHGQDRTTLHRNFAEQRDEQDVAHAASGMAAAAATKPLRCGRWRARRRARSARWSRRHGGRCGRLGLDPSAKRGGHRRRMASGC
jgi:hypothetical protein